MRRPRHVNQPRKKRQIQADDHGKACPQCQWRSGGLGNPGFFLALPADGQESADT